MAMRHRTLSVLRMQKEAVCNAPHFVFTTIQEAILFSLSPDLLSQDLFHIPRQPHPAVVLLPSPLPDCGSSCSPGKKHGSPTRRLLPTGRCLGRPLHRPAPESRCYPLRIIRRCPPPRRRSDGSLPRR